MADEGVVDSTPIEGGDNGTTQVETPVKESYTADEYKALQKENQKYRERWAPYEKTFSNPDAQVFLPVAQAYADGDLDTVAAWMIQNTASLKGADTDALVEFLEGGGDPGDLTDDDGEAPLTRAEVQAMLNEREQTFEQRQQQAQVQEIWSAAEDMGYERGTRDFVDLLHIATYDTGGDLEKADKHLKAERQKIIDDYLEGKRQERLGTPVQAMGQAPATTRRLSLEDGSARAAAEEYLANLG